MKQFKGLALALFAGILLGSCKGNDSPVAAETSNARNFIYFDATANFNRFTYRDSISYYLNKVKEAGVTDVVIDVKPITGEVLYPSKIAPVMQEWEGEYEAGKKDLSWDMLSEFIEKGHELGLSVHASTNVFVAGHNYFNRGVVYEDSTKIHWQTMSYLSQGMVPITEQKEKYSAMLNPAMAEVQEYQLSILEELVGMYPDLDGIILDRVRYDAITADFSEASKELFETYLGKEVKNFPQDIFTYDDSGSRIDGPLFKKWIEWRSTVIHDFIFKAKERITAVDQDIIFGDYTGAWYPTYYEVGVNWASKEYDPSTEFSWATEKYKETGYAEALDIFLTGNYFYEVEKSEAAGIDTTNVLRAEAGMDQSKAEWNTVEGSAEYVDKVVQGKTPIFSGLYVEQYNEDPEQFVKALKMCRKMSDGAMVFDIVHIINNGWWNELERGLKEEI